MRDFFVTIPDRIKILVYAILGRIDAFLLRQIDRFLQKRGEERVSTLFTFEELPILYDFDRLPYLRGDFDADFMSFTENLALAGEDVV
ncbi:MAG: hypothetical protein IPH62_19715 [Ignavibacteriae bacterium]|nr:hypothetical protein [Ignavibacteriota bacterium]